MQFRIPPSLITAVSGAGYRLGLLANNHAGDAGSQGYITTREVLTENGMDFIGTRGAVADKRYLVKDIGGIKIGLVKDVYKRQSSHSSAPSPSRHSSAVKLSEQPTRICPSTVSSSAVNRPQDARGRTDPPGTGDTRPTAPYGIWGGTVTVTSTALSTWRARGLPSGPRRP